MNNDNKEQNSAQPVEGEKEDDANWADVVNIVFSCSGDYRSAKITLSNKYTLTKKITPGTK